MIIDVNRQTIAEIKNLALASYANIYVGIYDQFMDQFKGTGVEIDPACYEQQSAEKMATLRQKGAIFRNQDKSIYVNQISPACVACQTGVGSATFFVSLKCHRDCYYCFNPNQEHYDHFTHHQRDLVAELAQVKAAGQKIKHLALTGGEPLLHKEEAVAFYRYASNQFPGSVSTGSTPAGTMPMKRFWPNCKRPGWMKFVSAFVCTIWPKGIALSLTGLPWPNNTSPT
jgi:uncharacterized protein